MIVSNEGGEWVARKLRCPHNPNAVCIALKRGGEFVAGVLYENWTGRSVVCHIAIEGRITSAYLAAIFHYPYVHLGLDKIIAPVAESNSDCRRLVERMGFTEEARIADAHPDGAILLYTMKPEACRFIGEKYGKRLKPAART